MFAFAVFALVAIAAADKPEPTGYNPAAQLVLLPLKSAAYTAPPQPQLPFIPVVPAPVESANVKAQVESVPSTTPKAAPAEEAQSGQYYILSPEGRLQKVEYFTAAQPQPEVAQKAAQYNAKPAPAQYNAEPAKPAQFKGTVSSFQYKDVEPVTAPIYSYTNVPGPLVRILRRAEYF
ncbi:unnamed protein product [Bemisia tabaci]|uniref:Cuticular protein n=1 Tax=Bemisia tabaci TaxID=7038 RepID=A0A9P0A009_BEMTA|nr:PREDICTED: uncharacterized protein LOC109037182 [Bemisia tabaci]CAH0381244.1 unnamed protein product [Bemisia tabaci]